MRCVTAPNAGPLTGSGTNSWLIGEGQVTLVDPGPDQPAHLDRLMASLQPGERISTVLITHDHADHAALLPALLAATGARTKALGPETILPGPTGPITALHTPGHHPRHFCLIGPGWAITGDHVMGWSSTMIAPPEGRMADYMASLDRLQATGALIGLPGHGPLIPDLPARIAVLRRHRLMREAAILAALQSGHSRLESISEQAYGPLNPNLTRAAKANCLAHLIDLAERNLIQCQPHPQADAIFRPM